MNTWSTHFISILIFRQISKFEQPARKEFTVIFYFRLVWMFENHGNACSYTQTCGRQCPSKMQVSDAKVQLVITVNMNNMILVK